MVFAYARVPHMAESTSSRDFLNDSKVPQAEVNPGFFERQLTRKLTFSIESSRAAMCPEKTFGNKDNRLSRQAFRKASSEPPRSVTYNLADIQRIACARKPL